MFTIDLSGKSSNERILIVDCGVFIPFSEFVLCVFSMLIKWKLWLATQLASFKRLAIQLYSYRYIERFFPMEEILVLIKSLFEIAQTDDNCDCFMFRGRYTIIISSCIIVMAITGSRVSLAITRISFQIVLLPSILFRLKWHISLYSTLDRSSQLNCFSTIVERSRYLS